MGRKLKDIFAEDRGQVGVGSLIIFIAIILVAAISAGVLLRASGVLSVRATSTSESATKEVSTKLEIFQITGYSAQSPPRTNITKVILSARLAPGSPPIAIDEIMVIYQAGDDYISGITFAGTGDKAFTSDFTRNVTGDDTLEEGETVDLHFDKGGGWLNLTKGSTFYFTIQPRSGTLTTVKKTVPNALPYAYTAEWG